MQIISLMFLGSNFCYCKNREGVNVKYNLVGSTHTVFHEFVKSPKYLGKILSELGQNHTWVKSPATE